MLLRLKFLILYLYLSFKGVKIINSKDLGGERVIKKKVKLKLLAGEVTVFVGFVQRNFGIFKLGRVINKVEVSYATWFDILANQGDQETMVLITNSVPIRLSDSETLSRVLSHLLLDYYLEVT